MAGDHSITALLTRWRQGDERALDVLMPQVYDHLRRIARRQMAGEAAAHTLSPTALVHEAVLRLLDADVLWQDRAHFLAIAARQMRNCWWKHARVEHRQKSRGADWQRVTLTAQLVASGQGAIDILAVDQTLARLAEFDSRKAQIVDLVLFGGMTAKEAAEVLHISEPTINRELRMAGVWLRHELQPTQA